MEYKKIKQIRYSDWGQILEPEHKNYWADIQSIASLIALHLEFYQTSFIRIKTDNKETRYITDKRTTIVVSQYKEKFGEIRVYCHLADPNLINEKYNSNKFNRMSLEDFRELCYVQDIIHYRNTYFIFRDLMPQYWSVMFSGADNPEYLYETKEEYLNDAKDTEWLLNKKDEIFKILEWDKE